MLHEWKTSCYIVDDWWVTRAENAVRSTSGLRSLYGQGEHTFSCSPRVWLSFSHGTFNGPSVIERYAQYLRLTCMTLNWFYAFCAYTLDSTDVVYLSNPGTLPPRQSA